VLTRLIDYLFAALFGTFQRMIFWELLRVFLLCLIALAGIFTLLAILQQIQFGVSLSQAVRMLPLLVPTSVPWITPPACLFASCVVYGRLANDNEALALKAAGVDVLSVLRPALVLGAVAAAFTAYLQFDITPQSWRGSREVLIEDPEEAIGLVLKRKQTLEFVSGNNMMKLSVRDVQVGTRTERVPGGEEGAGGEREVPEQRLLDVVIKQRKTATKGWDDPDWVARTRQAVLRVDTEARKVRLDAERWESLTRGSQGAGTSTLEKPAEMDLPQQFDLDKLRKDNAVNPSMVDWVHLLAAAAAASDRAELHRGYVSRMAELPDRTLSADEVKEFQAEVGIAPAAEPARRLQEVQDHQNNINLLARLDRVMRYEYYLRPAIAFGCLLFAVLGCPVGLWANRADYLSIFVICFLPALLVYYPVLFMVGGYARDGKIPMGLGVWTANGVLLVAAVVLSWRLIRR
jgi:lipopolysaccharide export system permease protein